MNRFVQFIFLLLVLGIAMALGIVVTANHKSSILRAQQNNLERTRLKETFARFHNRLRSADMIVEWQKVAGDGQILQTAILWQSHTLDASGRPQPLPLRRFVIPGDTVVIDAIILRFHKNYPILPGTEFLADTTLCMFNHLYGAGEKPSAANLIVPLGAIPMAFRPLDPAAPSLSRTPTVATFDPPGMLEIQLWQRIGDLRSVADASERDLTPVLPATTSERSLTITPILPATCTLKPNNLYDVGLGTAIGVDIQLRQDPGRIRAILQQAAELPATSATP